MMENNPYAPPATSIAEEPVDLGAVDLAEAEAIRRAYLNHEASVKSIGSLHFLLVFFAALSVLITAATAFSQGIAGNTSAQLVLIAGSLFYLVLGGMHLAMGIGLNRLQTWARWTEVALLCFGLMLVSVVIGTAAVMRESETFLLGLFGAMIPGYMLSLLVSSKSSRVFSPEYRAIIERTPHIKYQMGLLIKIALALFVMFIGLVFAVLVAGFLLG
jgi:hypothetical protein